MAATRGALAATRMTVISDSDFRPVAQRNLRAFQLLHVAMAMSIVTLLGVTFFLAHRGATGFPVLPAAAESLRWLTFIHIFITVGCYMLKAFVPAMMAVEPVQDAPALYVRLQGIRIVQLALMEGPAIAGMVTCLLGVRNGAIAEAPLYWLNLVTSVIFFVRLIRLFPSEEGLMGMKQDFETK